MQVTSKGQVTIPKKYRDVLGILPYTEVDFEMVGDELRLRKARGAHHGKRSGLSRGERIVRHMTGRLKGCGMTTDEIMALTRGE